MKISEFLKEYLKWFVPLAMFSVLAYLLFKPAALIGLLTLFVPMDRSRVKMLRRNCQLPNIKLAWKIIGVCMVAPFLLGAWLGSTVELELGQLRANVIVSFQLVFILPVLIISCICFLSKNVWIKALKKYGG